MSRRSSDYGYDSSENTFGTYWLAAIAMTGAVGGIVAGFPGAVVGLAVGALSPIILAGVIEACKGISYLFGALSNYLFNKSTVKQGAEPEFSPSNIIEHSVSDSARITAMLNVSPARSSDLSDLSAPSRDDRREDLDDTQARAVEPVVRKRTYAEVVANKFADEIELTESGHSASFSR